MYILMMIIFSCISNQSFFIFSLEKVSSLVAEFPWHCWRIWKLETRGEGPHFLPLWNDHQFFQSNHKTTSKYNSKSTNSEKNVS